MVNLTYMTADKIVNGKMHSKFANFYQAKGCKRIELRHAAGKGIKNRLTADENKLINTARYFVL